MRFSSLALLLVVAGCGEQPAPPGMPDASAGDATTPGPDAAPRDATIGSDAAADAGAVDGSTDAGPEATCDPSIGLVQPPATCSAAAPCTNTLPGTGTLTEASAVPSCRTSTDAIADGRPAYDDGPPRTWTDADGVTRYYCMYAPSGTEPKPVLLFFHGTGGSADNVYDLTSLRGKAASMGFILLSFQGRNLHWPVEGRPDESHHDVLHRDLGAPSTNRDVAFADAILDELASAGRIDRQRVHVSGWSNGGHFGQMYAIARHETPTAGELVRVASAAVYSAADPFNALTADEPACRLDPYPSTEMPLMIVGRTCDLIPCDAPQAADLERGGLAVPPGAIVEPWITTLQTTVGNPNVEWIRLTGGTGALAGIEATSCTGPALCSVVGATLNHVRWPDGVADGSGRDTEIRMLAFLEEHPLS